MEAGQRVDAETLRGIAKKLAIPHWHDLLSETERKLLGKDPARYHAAPLSTPSTMAGSPLASYRFQLPAAIPDFTGRGQLIDELVLRLSKNAAMDARPALRGMGGVGKTSLAVRVAHEVKGLFPDAQLLIDLRGTSGVAAGPTTPLAAMRQIIYAFRPEASNLPEDEKELAGVYRAVLAGKRALIILDNAGTEDQLRSLMTVPPPVALLITSRHALALDSVESIPLDALTPEEAYLLLRGIMGSRGARYELVAIAELCCQLPLALRVAADFLRLRVDWPVSRYVAALKGERLRWLKVGADPEKDVEAVLKLSAAQLVRDSVERGTRWHILHIFDGDFDLSAAASVWNADENDLGVLSDMSDLVNRSLVLFDHAARRYRLHDLMRPIAEGLFG
jgi:hypothetical protein